MMTPSDKRKASLSILQRLRQDGFPQKEETIDSMFVNLYGGEGEGEPGEGEESEEEMNSKEKKKKQKNPPLDLAKKGLSVP